jgi:hypothetical protein
MVNNKQVEWSYWICCLVLFGCCYLSFFEEENDQEGESSFDDKFIIKNWHLELKESKVMVDIFWYLMLFVGSELLLLKMLSVHNCTWI